MRYPIAIILILFSCSLFAQNLTKDQWAIEEKGWDCDKSHVYGKLEQADAADCGDANDTNDLALMFDISGFSTYFGESFDVNKIYIDGVGTGEVALNIWQRTFGRKDNLDNKVYTVQSQISDWSSLKIKACVGKLAQILINPDKALEKIVLWYDGNVVKEICNQPSCNIDSQTFSNGDMVGWYPQGYCNQASKWFTIVEKGGYEGYEPGIELELGDVCICR